MASSSRIDLYDRNNFADDELIDPDDGLPPQSLVYNTS
jgi:hypothetical protein